MSYAVESKKRKFHRVLESISKSSSAENAPKQSTPAVATPAHDRIPANLSIKKVRLSTNDTSGFTSVRDSVLKPSRPTTRITSDSSSKRPTFVPWDRDVFLERLETFRRVDRWTSKPSPINEVQWAKRGWICTDVMRVSCVTGCGGSVVVKVPDEIDELDGYDAEKVQDRKEVRMWICQLFSPLEWFLTMTARCETRGGVREIAEGRTCRELSLANEELRWCASLFHACCFD